MRSSIFIFQVRLKASIIAYFAYKQQAKSNYSLALQHSEKFLASSGPITYIRALYLSISSETLFGIHTVAEG